MNSFAPEVKGQAKAFASLLARSVREFFQDEQHRKEFEEWYLNNCAVAPCPMALEQIDSWLTGMEMQAEQEDIQ